MTRMRRHRKGDVKTHTDAKRTKCNAYLKNALQRKNAMEGNPIKIMQNAASDCLQVRAA